MKEKEMFRIAELLKRTLIDVEQPNEIRKEVAVMMGDFQKTEYCLEG
jgi:glycine/serine hydroxymethyltransferase